MCSKDPVRSVRSPSAGHFKENSEDSLVLHLDIVFSILLLQKTIYLLCLFIIIFEKVGRKREGFPAVREFLKGKKPRFQTSSCPSGDLGGEGG